MSEGKRASKAWPLLQLERMNMNVISFYSPLGLNHPSPIVQSKKVNGKKYNLLLCLFRVPVALNILPSSEGDPK